MEPMKMAQRPNLQALPNIHSTTSAKLPEFSDTTPTQSQSFRHRSSRSSFPSAKSVDSTIRYNHTVTAGSMPATLDSLLPDVGDEEQIDFGRIRIERKSHKSLLPPSIRQMANSMRTKSGMSMAQSVNASDPPLPFQPQYFKSSTVLKMVPVPRRHQDMFVESKKVTPREKPLIIHSERYQYNDPLRPGFDRLTQRERLMAEREYVQKLKHQKLARETLPHRETRDLLMGGQRVSFNERFDVKDELRRLKAIVLPVNARELYHGKGISLPPTHSSIKPRHKMPPPLPIASSPEPEEELVKEAVLYRHSKTSLDGLKSKASFKKSKQTRSKVDSTPAATKLALPGRSHTMPVAPESARSVLSRRSTESNFMTLPEDDYPEMSARTPSVVGSEGGDYNRVMGRETAPPSALNVTRAESEMDIVFQTEVDPGNGPAKARTPIKAPTPNPLKAADLSLYQISEQEMKAVFQKLDTDSDGHLMYQQVEPQFPANLNKLQKRYLKQIYDITSASTFFGVKEFVTMKCLCEEVSKLDSELLLTGFESLNFTTLTTIIIQYTELFQQIDRSAKGKIAVESLEDILCSALQRDKQHIEYGLSLLKTVLQLDGGDVNKVKFIAGIPFFLTIPNLQKPEEENQPEEPEGETPNT